MLTSLNFLFQVSYLPFSPVFFLELLDSKAGISQILQHSVIVKLFYLTISAEVSFTYKRQFIHQCEKMRAQIYLGVQYLAYHQWYCKESLGYQSSELKEGTVCIPEFSSTSTDPRCNILCFLDSGFLNLRPLEFS